MSVRAAIVELDPEGVERANRIYSDVRFERSTPADRTFGIADSGEWIALGRVCHRDDGAVEIGGFWTHPEHRGEGHARAVVSHVLGTIEAGTRVWCIPFDHLVPFYTSFGLEPVPEGTAAPASIVAKLQSCGSAFSDPGGPRASHVLAMTKG